MWIELNTISQAKNAPFTIYVNWLEFCFLLYNMYLCGPFDNIYCFVMKRLSLIVCAFATLLFLSCEKETPNTKDPFDSISQSVVQDFNYRYPDVIVSDAYQWHDSDKNTITDISFTDQDGLVCKAKYKAEKWMVTEKRFDVNDFLSKLPRKVVCTYLNTGIENEEYLGDNSYVLEFSRNGINNKQYEFYCTAPYMDGDRLVEHLVYSIIIADDGTLLTCSHGEFNRSIWWYDMTSSIELVRSKYTHASILGAVDDGGNNVIFIREDGILKTVNTHDYGRGYEWVETYYPLDINTALPDHVIAQKEAYEAEHPDSHFYAVWSYEFNNKNGMFYGLTYGTELNNVTFFVQAE